MEVEEKSESASEGSWMNRSRGPGVDRTERGQDGFLDRFLPFVLCVVFSFFLFFFPLFFPYWRLRALLRPARPIWRQGNGYVKKPTAAAMALRAACSEVANKRLHMHTLAHSHATIEEIGSATTAPKSYAKDSRLKLK